MRILKWRELPDGGAVASGEDWNYFVAHDDHQVVLTRWELREDRDELPAAAAIVRQVALNTISLGGAYGVMPETAVSVIGHLKDAAQQYESGVDVSGRPAWRHHTGTCLACGSEDRGERVYVAGATGQPVECSSDWHSDDAQGPGYQGAH